ncbi:MAG: molybdenum cofactor biosynthesis protein MoaE [Actinomycetota bacterium]
MRDRLLIRVTDDPLDPAEATAFTTHPSAGGLVLFAGTVRDHSEGGPVEGLEYEAWAEMAERRLVDIGQELLRRWSLCRAALLHRWGRLDVGEVSVLVCCSAPHRAEAFEAARHGIERIKRDVPVWKKEILTTGESHWVKGS